MQVGMTIPSMVEGVDRDQFLAWCRGTDEGPYSTLAVGERITYHNLEMTTSLAAAAVATERVRVMSTVVILPMHPANLVAKQMATIDVLSAGRLDVSVGIGGRDSDFRAVEADETRRHQRMDEAVAQLKRVWEGDDLGDDLGTVGPRPVQQGGPPLFAGVMGPKAVARAARWASGVTGFVTDPSVDALRTTFDRAESAWTEAGRAEPPKSITSFWYSLGSDEHGDRGAGEQLRAYARRYLGVFGEEVASAMADSCTVAGEDALRAALDQCEEAGCDEVILVPTTAEPDELGRTSEIISDRMGG